MGFVESADCWEQICYTEKKGKEEIDLESIKSGSILGEKNPKGIHAAHLIRHEHVRVTTLTLQPGDHVPPHEAPVEVLFYVVSGRGTLGIGEERAIVVAQDMVQCPRGTSMALWADQGEEMVVFNVKTPDIP